MDDDSGTREDFEVELTELASDAYALALNAWAIYGKASPVCNVMGRIADELRMLAGDVEAINRQKANAP